MSIEDKVFSGSIPEFYDTYMVPLIFEAYAENLSKRISNLTPKSVLETAAGSGVVTRTLAPMLCENCRYVVTDLNPPMLEHARSKQTDEDNLEWAQADALNLPFDDAVFDVVFCQFGAMFFPDRVAGFAEALRVLKPGGHYIFNVWDRIETNEFADIVTKAAADKFPSDPPRFLARTPHGYHDPSTIRADTGRAGFSEVSLETLTFDSHADTARHPAMAYCHGTPLRNEIMDRDARALDEVTDLAEQALIARYGPGPIKAPMQAHVVTAIK